MSCALGWIEQPPARMVARQRAEALEELARAETAWGLCRSTIGEELRQERVRERVFALARAARLDVPPAETCQWIASPYRRFHARFCDAPNERGSYCLKHSRRAFAVG